MRRSGFAIVVALGLGLLSGCGSDVPSAPSSTPAPTPLPTPTPGTDAISLSSISPAAGTALQAGQEVAFTATVSYTLASAASGRVSMIIQDQLNRSLQPLGTHPTAVSGGTATVTLTDSIVIPATGVSLVRVFLPLYPASATSTSVVALGEYPIR
jgi:hypothetical protein